MEVEGIHLPSEDTEQGNRIHRRVDQPSSDPTINGAKDDDRPRAVRSLTLTSERLGLTATLDLAEINGSAARPIEYRKGRSRKLYGQADNCEYDHGRQTAFKSVCRPSCSKKQDMKSKSAYSTTRLKSAD